MILKHGFYIRFLAFFLIFHFLYIHTNAQSDSTSLEKATSLPAKKWYDQVAISGYTQVRYNGLFQTNENLSCEQCDRSWGKKSGFFIRRIRVVFQGQVTSNLFFYIQPDFASSPGGDRLNFGQIRDAYVDVGLDKNNEFRFRIGQSKVPFGFENMQSSQNRIALDRNDALNSAVANERDLGVFFYWAPKEKRDLFRELVKSGLKGTGDYGVFGLGIYNGQTASSPELNDGVHIVSRFSYPFNYKNQTIEAGIQAYTGKYVIPQANLSPGVKYNSDLNYVDQRIGASFILYPKPFGIQAEYNIGQGPEFNKLTGTIENASLKGGYIQSMYYLDCKGQTFIPFIRYQYYNGGKKHEIDARSYLVEEFELGVEWQLSNYFEIVPMYTNSHRRYEDYTAQNNDQKGSLMRFQAQFRF